jgi:hypothetical protein
MGAFGRRARDEGWRTGRSRDTGASMRTPVAGLAGLAPCLTGSIHLLLVIRWRGACALKAILTLSPNTLLNNGDNHRPGCRSADQVISHLNGH